MQGPFDYTMNVVNPLEAVQRGLAFGQGLRAAEQDMAMRAEEEKRNVTRFGWEGEDRDMMLDDRQRAIAEQDTARQAAVQMQSDMAALAAKVEAGEATYADFSAISLKYPDVASELKTVWDGQTEERRKADAAGLFKAGSAIKMGRPDLAAQMLEDYAVAAENSGQKMEADLARSMAKMAELDPAASLTNIGILLGTLDQGAAESLFGVGDDRSVQSTNAYANGTTVTIFTDGSKEVTDATGSVLSGPDATAAVESAMASEAEMRGANAGAAEQGKLDARIDKGGEAAATEEAGKQAIAKSGEAFDSLNKVKENIANVDIAIKALDDGANSGVIAKYFPDVTAASAGLTNAMNRLGLDVIASVTFGALSEGEMRLAMETAVPRNLNELDLRKWLSDKRAAQEKAAEALTAAAIYLGTPGNTLAGWLESKGKPTAPAADPNSQPASAAPAGGLSFEDAFSRTYP
jgi:hypothetical protein